MSPDLERLIRLQQLDNEVEARRRSLAELPNLLQALDVRIEARQAAVDAAKAKLAENQTARRALDKDLAVVQGRLTRFKDQLMEVKTNKEYTAMQHEIATAQEGVRLFEDQILERLVQADDIDGELKAAETALTDERKLVAEERTTRQQAATRMERETEELSRGRAQIVGEMSREAIALFEHVARSRKSSSVAEARDGHCTACHVRLRPQVFNEVRRGDKLMQCESCSRILYVLPPKPPASTTQAASAPA